MKYGVYGIAADGQRVMLNVYHNNIRLLTAVQNVSEIIGMIFIYFYAFDVYVERFVIN